MIFSIEIKVVFLSPSNNICLRHFLKTLFIIY